MLADEKTMATVKAVKDFFEYEKISEFTRDWAEMPEKDRDDLKRGIGDGTLNY